MIETVVVGAGLCGLTVAYQLAQQGRSVLLLEQSPQVGGVIQSVQESGYLTESGPHTFQSSAHAIFQLANSLGLTPKAVSEQAKNRYVYWNQRLIPVPTSPLSFITSPLLTPGAKLRLLCEPFQSSRNACVEESVASFAKRRLGPEVLERLLTPFLSGVYAGNAEQLSIDAVFPKLAEWEQQYGSLLKGAIQTRQQKKRAGVQPGSRPKSALWSFLGGMADLTQAMARKIPSQSIQLNTGVTQIQPISSGGYQLTLNTGDTIQAKSLVLAVPAYIAAIWVQAWAPELQQCLSGIQYVPLAVVHTGFPQEQFSQLVQGFGFLSPPESQLALMGTIFTSSLFPERVPERQVLYSSFVGGALAPERASQSDINLLESVTQSMHQVFQSPQLEPTYHRIIRYAQAIPQYNLGHTQRIQTIEQQLNNYPGLQLTGNYLRGVSLNDCVKQALDLANRL